ncbi:MAG: WD40 repeat domain-containing protein [Planctomycetota bacterium]|nr:WD40 repeat domain-containing protein [Planctomycetota bacterium]
MFKDDESQPKSVRRCRSAVSTTISVVLLFAACHSATDLMSESTFAQQQGAFDEILTKSNPFLSISNSPSDSSRPNLLRLDPIDPNGLYAPIVTALAASRDGKWLVAAGDDHAIRVVDRSTGKLHKLLEGHLDWVQSVAILDDNQTILSCGNDGTLRAWSVEPESKSFDVLYRGTIALLSMAISPDNQFVAIGGFGNAIRVHDIRTGKLHREMICECNDQRALAFSGDGLQLASGGRDGVLRIWSLASGDDKPLVPLEQKLHNGRIRSVSFSSDASVVTTVAEDRRLVRYRTHDGQIFLDQKINGGKLMAMTTIDSRLVAVAGADNTIRIMDSEDGKEVHRLVGHDGSVVTLLRSGDELISSSFDTTIRYWSLEKAVQHDAAPYEHPVSARYVDSGVSENIR